MLGLFLSHIIGYDIWFYISHRLLHTKYLWWIHKIHHEKKYPTIWDTHFSHWSESIIQSVGIGLPFLFFEPNWYVFFAAAFFTNTRGYMRHDIRTAWLIGNHHMLHHEFGNVNYGDYYMDWLFGTLDARPDKRVHGLIRI